MTKTVLIAGASGHFGRAASHAFAAAGWQLRHYQRGSDMARAAEGADVIVNALNPPHYHDWARNIPAITKQVIAAARASAARVLVPGNVYVYGDEPGPWGPATPHRPISRKGAIRAQMEAAYHQSGLPVLILRGGDFIDPASSKTLFAMMTKGLSRDKITHFGPPQALHAYAPLGDMARAAAALVLHPDLPRFADIPFAGLAFSIHDLRDEVQRQTGRDIRLAPFPWWAMRLAAPFWELARELLEMRYLNTVPHHLDPGPMAALLPDFRGQTLAEVVAEMLAAGGVTAG